MTDVDLTKFIALILVCEGPGELRPRVLWPLHAAIREVYDWAGRSGHRKSFGFEPEFAASPDVGVEVVGAGRAIFELIQNGTLEARGEYREARLILNPQSAIGLRRELMQLAPAQTAVLQRAATRWAALESTSAKNAATASRSPGDTNTSSTPKRANAPSALTA